jgi:Uma2 family endonuclease
MLSNRAEESFMTEVKLDHLPLRDVDDFLDWVQRQDGRFEFVDGRVVAMAGGTRAHSTLQTRLIVMLDARLQGGPCRVHGSDLLIRTDPGSNRRGRFADAVVECVPPTDDRMIEQPAMIFEILSAETELVDRTVKLREYQGLPSLQHYVLVAQDLALVEAYTRHSGGTWLYTKLEGQDTALRLTPPGIELPLRELYRDVLEDTVPPSS